MGVVSQFDVLWDELTGIEHMYLFQKLKRVDLDDYDRLVKQRLTDVGLQDVGNQCVGQYSGGMRRRISVALSTMGNPSIILMDEPTTGMDPVSRRHVWNLIQRLKQKKVIIMSTHAMEEAECLSDKLIVLDHGEVQCVGTPLKLKNMLGNGYRVSMISNQKDIAQVKNLVKSIVPSSQFQEQSGESGSLVWNVPMENVSELGSIFSILEQLNDTQKEKSDKKTSQLDKNIESLRKLVTDVGVSQSTLEEVFLAVTSGLMSK